MGHGVPWICLPFVLPWVYLFRLLEWLDAL